MTRTTAVGRRSWPSTRRRRGSSSRPARPDGTADGVSTWVAGYRHGETLLPVDRAVPRRAEPPAVAAARHRRRDRPGGVHRPAGRAWRRPRAWPTASGSRSSACSTGEALLAAAGQAGRGDVLLLPAGPVRPGRSSGRRRATPAARRHGPGPCARRDASSRSTSRRAPADAVARGEAARDGLGQALLRLGAARLRAARRDRRARDARARVRDPAARRRRRQPGRDMVARPPVRLVIEPMAARRRARHPRHRGGELHDALAARRLPQRARDQPAGALPRRPGRRRPSRPTAGCG